MHVINDLSTNGLYGLSVNGMSVLSINVSHRDVCVMHNFSVTSMKILYINFCPPDVREFMDVRP